MKPAACDKGRCFSFSPLRLMLVAALLLVPSVVSAMDVTVSCSGPMPGAFTTIGAALAALDYTGPNTITVTGTCVENVNIQSRERLTLQAPVGNVATIVNAASPVFWTLNVGRSRQVTLRRLTVKGGSIGIRTDGASSVDIEECTVEQNQTHGIEVGEQSTVRINRTTIRNNGILGLSVYGNSSVWISPDGQFIHIHNNGSTGMSASGSYVSFNGRTTIEDNGGNGINANGSFVQINGGGTIEDNAGSGITITGGRLVVNGQVQENFIRGNGFGVNISGGTATFNGQNTIQNNGDTGVQVAGGASATFSALQLSDGSSRVNVIEGHGTIGLHVAAAASATLSGPNIIRNNGGAGFGLNDEHGGVNIGTVSRVQFTGGNQITNNIGPGVTARFNGAIALGDSVVTNNAEQGLLLIRQSVGVVETGARISGNGTANVSCDTTSLVAGDLSGISSIDCAKIERALGPPRPGATRNLGIH